MSITIPDELLQTTQLSEREMLLELAVALFQKERLTLGQASRLAGLSQFEFQRLLGSRRIPLHYSATELDEDIATLRELGHL